MENSSQNSVFIVTVMSTKGGVTKSTNMANISAFCADCGLRTLMIDTDVQPTLPTYYTFDYTAPQGLFEFLIQGNTNPEQVISKTEYQNLDIIRSTILRMQLQHIYVIPWMGCYASMTLCVL